VSKLIFSPDGRYLLHWFRERQTGWSAGASIAPEADGTRVVIWDVEAEACCGTAPGYLVGMASDARTFLTMDREGATAAWQLVDGASIPLEQINPTAYSIAQRRALQQTSAGLRIVDALGGLPTVEVDTPDKVTQAVLGPRLWISFWYDLGDGLDGAYGRAIDLETGDSSWDFQVGRHATAVPAYWSATHNLVLLGEKLTAHTIDLGERVDEAPFKAQVEAIREAVGHKSFHGLGAAVDGQTLAVSTCKRSVQLWRGDEQIATLELER